MERGTGVDRRENAKEEKGGKSLTIELLDYRKRKERKNFISFDAANRNIAKYCN